MAANQDLQSQGVNRTHQGIGLKAAVLQEEGDNRRGYKDRTTSIAVFWMEIQREQRMSLNVTFNLTKEKVYISFDQAKNA